MSYFEFDELPESVRSLISIFVSMNTGTYGENEEYYRGGYELIMYSMPNDEFVDKENNLNQILKRQLSPEDYIDLGPYA